MDVRDLLSPSAFQDKEFTVIDSYTSIGVVDFNILYPYATILDLPSGFTLRID